MKNGEPQTYSWELRRRRRMVNPRCSWGRQKKNGEPQRCSWGRQKKNGEAQRYSWEGRRGRMVNLTDVAGEGRRRRSRVCVL